MMKRLIACAVSFGVGTAVLAQPAPIIEVASIKRNASGRGPLPPNVLWLPGDRLSATGLTLTDLIRSAYVGDGIQIMDQIVGGPRWSRVDEFDIVGKLANVTTGNASEANRQRREALKLLLADRFKLKVHIEQHDMPVFDLVRAGKGDKLPPQLVASTCGVNGNRPCQLSRLVKMDPATGLTMAYEGMTMPQLAAAIVSFPAIGRPIRDRTGLSGAFDLQLTMPMPQGATGDGEAAILTALQELGLKLEGRRDRADVVVIDSAELPAEE